MAITFYEPTQQSLSLRDAVSRLFEDSFVRPDTPRGFALDVSESDEALIVHAALPGFSKENLEIHVENELLTLKAESQAEESTNRYHLRERSFGSFRRTLRLPFPVDSDRATADFKDGVLTLTLPKIEAVKPRTIKVN
jgi:HSP20 family protein